MINKRLVICQNTRDFHFSKWELTEWKKYFKEVSFHYLSDDLKATQIKKDDIIFVYAFIGFYSHVDCFAKFGIFYPGFAYHPLKNPEKQNIMKPIEHLLTPYSAIFANEGPIWECYKNHSNFFLVPPSVSNDTFKKTRKRTKFKKIIQVANPVWPYKGRHISEAAMKLMPYEWELVPSTESKIGYVPWKELPNVYQNADGFLSPNMIGEPPGYYIDAKYTCAMVEAGLSGCIIFWHDCMNLGNSFETVFEISLDPIEIANKVQEVVGSIDLDKHSTKTAKEFYEKCNVENAIKSRIQIMEKFL